MTMEILKCITKKWIVFSFAGLMILLSYSVAAEIAVIVHPSNVSSLDAKEVKKIFLGKSKRFPSGEQVDLFVHSGASAEEFNKKILKKSPSQFKAYWSKLAFSGKAKPPNKVSNDKEVKHLVSFNTGAIGYIDASQVDDSVKVLLMM